MLLVVAFSAIILPLVLLVGLRLPARIGMPIAAIIISLLAATVWQMDTLGIAASYIQGAHRALTIGWILFGALFLLHAMQSTGYLDTIKEGFFRISHDMRIQTVLVAFLFVSLLEGVSGFGTPAAIAVPLLIALGFSPITSVVLALVGDSVAVSFGAIATPIFIGLENIPGANDSFFYQIGASITILDFAIATLLPTLLVALLLSLSRRSRRGAVLLEIIPWSFFVGLVYAFTAFIVTRLVGPAFAAIITSVITLGVALLSIKKKFLTPTTVWKEKAVRHISVPIPSHRHLLAAWTPYFAVIGLLVLQRVIPPIKTWLSTHADLSLRSILGFESINSVWPILASPGTVLVVVAVGTLLIKRTQTHAYKNALKEAGSSTLIALTALIPTLMMIQVFANSGLNSENLLSMPSYIAAFLATHVGFLWGALSPLLGMLAAFITGSSTVSTLTMSPIQYSTAIDLGLPVTHVLSQQISGANAGNMIAIHNVVAALAAAKLHHQEWRVIRKAILPSLFYLAMTILSGIIILFVSTALI